MDRLVTVIVPVFNVEKYVSDCIESLINQSYSLLEIILVDDGSTDKSGIICDKYSQFDTRIKTFHKKNGGLSDARNFGIKKASGEYYAFVDSDDVIHPQFIETLLSICIEKDIGISKCRIINFDARKSLKWDTGSDCKFFVKEYTSEEYLSEINKLNAGYSVCNKLFDSALFDGISFPFGKLHEDVAVIYKLIEKSGRIAECNADLYAYRTNVNSITKKIVSSHRLDDLEFRLEFYRFCKKKKYKKASKSQAEALFYSLLNFEALTESEVADYPEYRSRLFKYKMDYIKSMIISDDFSLKEKCWVICKLLV